MALTTTHKDSKFSVGDMVRVHLAVNEPDKEKSRTQIFEGTVIKIRGRGRSKSFTVRRVGAQKVGIEQIFPLDAPTIKKVEVAREGRRGVKRGKLYYIRGKSPREVEKIYSRARKRGEKEEKKEQKAAKSASKSKKKAKGKKKPSKKAKKSK